MRSSGIAGIFKAGTLILPIGQKPEAPILLAGDLDANGATDLVAINVDGDSLSVLLNKKYGQVCQLDLGFGGPGTATFSVCGNALATGGSANLLLTGASPNSPAWIIASTAFAPTPFFGGTLVPLPAQLIVPLFTDASGQFALPGIAGGGGPFGVYAQFVIADASQPDGIALSNAVKLEFLP
jgi:hypothetical protein